MKNDGIFVIIVNCPSPFDDFNLLGCKLSDCQKKRLGNLPYFESFCPCEAETTAEYAIKLASEVCRSSECATRLANEVCKSSEYTVKLAGEVCKSSECATRLTSEVCRSSEYAINLTSEVCKTPTHESGFGQSDAAKNGDAAGERSARFLAVVFSDMPLVSEKSLVSAAEYMKKKKMSSLGIGKGVIVDRKHFDGCPPTLTVTTTEFLSADSAAHLAEIYGERRRQINEKHLESGVILLEKTSAVIEENVKIESGVVIRGAVQIEGETEIGAGSTVGPCAVIRNSKIGKNCRIGDFVELKNATLSDGVKVAHLAYIGDAAVGANTNIGCGAVFANYDGKNKHYTTVGENCFIGANVNLIAPIRVDKGAFVAAGTTVTADLPENSFCIGRCRETVKNRKNST